MMWSHHIDVDVMQGLRTVNEGKACRHREKFIAVDQPLGAEFFFEPVGARSARGTFLPS